VKAKASLKYLRKKTKELDDVKKDFTITIHQMKKEKERKSKISFTEYTQEAQS